MEENRKSKIVEKDFKFFLKTLSFLTILCLLLFFSSFGFRDSHISGWYQQWFPNLNGSTIASMTFLDSLIGYATTTKNSSNQTYILKTTNGGDNWFSIFIFIPTGINTYLSKVVFSNCNTGFVSTNDAGDFFKTTNAGVNWIDYPVPVVAYDFSVINSDTLLHVNNTGFGPGVYRSVNGGLNWQGISQTGIYSIYMYNKNLGFGMNNNMYRTTNGGVNWTAITGETYSSIQMIDSMVGWKCYDSIKKTTNGGLNWFAQRTPNISHNFGISSGFSIINKDTVWNAGARLFSRAPVYITTNGGLNWGYQIPDTTLQIYSYGFIEFVNNKVGWANPGGSFPEIHTVVGGNDTTFFTNIKEPITNITSDYKLFQNYPNPFNPITNIEYKIEKTANIKIIVFDITGKEITTLVNEKRTSGNYEVKFDGTNLSSGIYFYTLFVDGVRIDTKKAVLLK